MAKSVREQLIAAQGRGSRTGVIGLFWRNLLVVVIGGSAIVAGGWWWLSQPTSTENLVFARLVDGKREPMRARLVAAASPAVKSFYDLRPIPPSNKNGVTRYPDNAYVCNKEYPPTCALYDYYRAAMDLSSSANEFMHDRWARTEGAQDVRIGIACNGEKPILLLNLAKMPNHFMSEERYVLQIGPRADYYSLKQFGGSGWRYRTWYTDDLAFLDGLPATATSQQTINMFAIAEGDKLVRPNEKPLLRITIDKAITNRKEFCRIQNTG